MPRRSSRIDRKLHRRYLDLGVIDASQNTDWRRRLFAAPLHQEFVIDAANTMGLPEQVARGVRRYALEFCVCRVTQEETDFREPGWEDCEFFRFRARRYPEIVSFSANNPDVV
jgi:hypothetical protein